MLSLTVTTGYAVLALGCLSDTRDSFVMARQIADCTSIPAPYLSKILNTLVHAGLVDGKRGYLGGYRLNRPAEELSLLELAELMEGPDWLDLCFLGLDFCDAETPCPTHSLAVSLREQVRARLQGLTVADMAEFQRQPSGAKLKRCCPVEGPNGPSPRPAAEPCTGSNCLSSKSKNPKQKPRQAHSRRKS